jgi:hypothetical protein
MPLNQARLICSQNSSFRTEHSLSFRTERSEVRNLKAQQAKRSKRDFSLALEMTKGRMLKRILFERGKSYLSFRTERSGVRNLFKPNTTRKKRFPACARNDKEQTP